MIESTDWYKITFPAQSLIYLINYICGILTNKYLGLRDENFKNISILLKIFKTFKTFEDVSNTFQKFQNYCKHF